MSGRASFEYNLFDSDICVLFMVLAPHQGKLDNRWLLDGVLRESHMKAFPSGEGRLVILH